MAYYNDRTKNGSTIGHGGQIRPHDISVDGQEVSFAGQMSRKTFETINERGLVLSSTMNGQLWCASTEAAQEVADAIRKNEVHPKHE